MNFRWEWLKTAGMVMRPQRRDCLLVDPGARRGDDSSMPDEVETAACPARGRRCPRGEKLSAEDAVFLGTASMMVCGCGHSSSTPTIKGIAIPSCQHRAFSHRVPTHTGRSDEP